MSKIVNRAVIRGRGEISNTIVAVPDSWVDRQALSDPKKGDMLTRVKAGDESICPRMTLGFYYFCSDSLPEYRYSLLNWLLESDSFARQPGKFAVSPKVEMDASSETLSGGELNGAVHSSVAFSSPCVFPRPTPIEWPPPLSFGVAHLLIYHLVLEGGAVVEMEDGRSLEFKPGDVVISPHGDAHHTCWLNTQPRRPSVDDRRSRGVGRHLSIRTGWAVAVTGSWAQLVAP